MGSVYANENIYGSLLWISERSGRSGNTVSKEWVLEDRDLIVGDMRVELPDNMRRHLCATVICQRDICMMLSLKKDSEYRKIFLLSAMTTICSGIVLQTV